MPLFALQSDGLALKYEVEGHVYLSVSVITLYSMCRCLFALYSDGSVLKYKAKGHA